MLTEETVWQQTAGIFPTVVAAARRESGGKVYTDTLAGKRLAPRELQVMAALCEGLPNKEIAFRLGVTTGTLKGYLFHMMLKCQCDSRLQLAVCHLKHCGKCGQLSPI